MPPYKISVIIPSYDGYRGGNIKCLKEELERQSRPPFEIITVVGVSPNGKSRNYGVMKASGDYFVFIDDDVRLGNSFVLEKLIMPFLESNDIGMTGPSQLIPPESNYFQKISAKQIPRSLFPVQNELIDSDMASHMCLAMPAKLFKKIGWENSEIISGTDPDLRYRVRKAGYRVCVVPNCWAYHPMPDNLQKLLKLAFIKGRNSAITQIDHPGLVCILDDGTRKEFTEKRGFFYRVITALLSLVFSIFTLKFIYLTYRIAYFLGYLLAFFERRK